MAPRIKGKEWCILLAILAVGACLRFWKLDAGCVWYDELWHAELSNGVGSAHLHLPTNLLIDSVPSLTSSGTRKSVPDIWRNMDLVLHPPVYHTLLHFWRAALGDSVVALRSFSAAWSVLAILLTFFAARLTIGTTGALWASAIIALSGAQLGQAQDARGYTLLLCEALVAAILVLRLREKRSLPASIAIGATALLMMLTHYFAFGACAAIALFAIFALPDRRARLESSAALLLAGGVFVLIWLPTVREQLNCVPQTADVFLKDGSPGHLLRTVVRVIEAPARLLADSTEIPRAAVLLAGLVIGGLVAGALATDPRLRFWLLWLACPVITLAALDLSRQTLHLDFVRYYLVASPAVAIALASLCSQTSLLKFAPVAVTVACVATVWTGFSSRLQNPDPRDLCRYLDEHLTSRDSLLVCSSPAFDGYNGKCVYLYLTQYTRLFPRGMAILTAPAGDELLNSLPAGGDLFLVSGDPSLPLDSAVAGARVVDRRQYDRGGVVVRVTRD